jgi:streptogramin lyase
MRNPALEIIKHFPLLPVELWLWLHESGTIVVGLKLLHKDLQMTALRYIALILFSSFACAQQRTGTFETVGAYRGIGRQLATIVAPGKTPGSERFYASYSYGAKSFDVLSIDPDTGNTEVFHSPITGEIAAWSFVVGPQGNVFLGTAPTGHLVELDTKQRQLIDRGQPTNAETYIWDVTFGSDGLLYGATFPRCKLIRYDPSTGRMEDLGRLDPTEQYARSIVGSSDGFIYAGIGSSKANIAAYNIRTGEHREILPADVQIPALAKVYRGQDGNIYGAVGVRQFRLNGWTATELNQGHTVAPATTSMLRDGRTLALSENMGSLTLTVTDPKTHEKVNKKISYQGQEMQLMRIGFGPDGVLYGSTAVPIDLVKADISNHRMEEIGGLGNGEVYSFLSHNQTLLMAAYAGLTTLMSYDPKTSFKPAAKSGNPLLVPFNGDNSSWRPMAMINGPDGNVYIGSVGGYGLLEAPLLEWDGTNSVQQFNGIVADQSIVSLAVWHNFVLGGTSVTGGEGSHATQKEAQLFFWNPKTQAKVFNTVPVPGAPSITDLITAPNDHVYGIAGDTLFVFDPGDRKVISKQKLPFSKPIYNSVALGKEGKIWGLAEEGIFAIDTKNNSVELVARPPVKINGGFALRDGEVYFISGTTIYRYKM